MKKMNLLIFYSMFVFCQVSFWCAIFMIAIYYEPANEITYTTPLTFRLLWNGFAHVHLQAFQQAFTFLDIFFFIATVLGFIVFTLTKTNSRNVLRFVFFVSQPFLCFWGWFGLLMIPNALYGGIDGEWLAEHSPTMIATGFWIISSIVIAIMSIDIRWVKN